MRVGFTPKHRAHTIAIWPENGGNNLPYKIKKLVNAFEDMGETRTAYVRTAFEPPRELEPGVEEVIPGGRLHIQRSGDALRQALTLRCGAFTTRHTGWREWYRALCR